MSETPILLNVDDHEVARYAKTRILTGAGFRVHEASTAADTLSVAAKHRPDLILLDVHLPDGNGIDICRQIKAAQDGTSVMVLQISASALSASNAKEALDAGADGYLMEPVDADVLVATVKALLRLHRAERSVVHANRQLEIVNKELQRSNRDLQQFAFAASHDLQEPLRTISTFSQLIEHELNEGLTDTQKAYFRRVSESTIRMQALIHDLLAYSKVGREGRPQSVVELETVLRAAKSNLAEQIRVSGCRVDVPQPLPSVLGDFTNLISVFHNLLSNALKYRDPNRTPVVHIVASQESPAERTIRITDNGIGINPKYHQRIFEPFKRLHGAEIPGTGIGLALCQRIVETHGGRIMVESTPGEGSTFCVTLLAA
jgi:signal transduction histidine kinase